MAVNPRNTGDELGELRFEFFDEENVDSDKQFNSSVKNLLVLIKDFYGADSAVVYWFNKSKQGFKLLAATEDERIGANRERFPLGNDFVSTVCLGKKAEIFNIESDKDRELVAHHNEDSPVKSIIANPLLLENETIAVVLCESKTLNFFGTPNVYTLQVFSESVSNYIKYFSLSEDFEFTKRLLGLLASGKLRSNEDVFSLIKSVFERYASYEHLFFVFRAGEKLKVVKSYSVNENEKLFDGIIEEESIAYGSAESKKIEVRNINVKGKGIFRFSKNEKMDSDLWFCCLPLILDEECEAILAFDAKTNVHMNQKTLSKIYSQILPPYLLLRARQFAAENEGIFSGKDNFVSGLDSAISKCRLFNENNLYCVYFGVDNIESLLNSEIKVEELLSDFLLERLPGQNLVFKVDDNKYAFIADVSSDEKIFLETEKLRKALSGKIYNIEGKDISLTASFAVKRFEDLGVSRDEFLEEIDRLYELARKEGGDVVKI